MKTMTEYVFFEVTLSIPSGFRQGEQDIYGATVAVDDRAAYYMSMADLAPYILQAARDIICGPGVPYTVLSIKRAHGCCVFADVPEMLYRKALLPADALLDAITEKAKEC